MAYLCMRGLCLMVCAVTFSAFLCQRGHEYIRCFSLFLVCVLIMCSFRMGMNISVAFFPIFGLRFSELASSHFVFNYWGLRSHSERASLHFVFYLLGSAFSFRLGIVTFAVCFIFGSASSFMGVNSVVFFLFGGLRFCYSLMPVA
jgi:hypothetical protein